MALPDAVKAAVHAFREADDKVRAAIDEYSKAAETILKVVSVVPGPVGAAASAAAAGVPILVAFDDAQDDAVDKLDESIQAG